MVESMKKAGLVLSGAVAGVMLSLGLTAYADKNEEAKSAIPIEDLQKFSQVLGLIKGNYVDDVADKKIIENAISGMVKELDPHSSYFDEKDFEDLKEGISGKFSGVGLEVQPGKGAIQVISPIEDSPAFKAGVQAGDSIVKIDDHQVSEMRGLSEAISKLRGQEGTNVRITVVRKGESKPLVFNITRAVIKSQSIKGKIIEPGYAWIRITQFQEPTLKDFVAKAKELYAQGKVKGLVLDLRNDPGGSLDTAVGISAAFLPAEVTVVSSKGMHTETEIRKADPKDYARGGKDVLKDLPEGLKDVPLVVLVNGGSASASEIVAGALQDHKRATIIGSQTFGKGSVQQVIPLDREGKTGVKLTIARYYTPSGKSIQARGVIPEVLVDDYASGKNGRYSRESDLPGHLSNDSGVAVDKPRDVWDEWAKEADDEKKDGKDKDEPPKFGDANDFPLQQALHYLKGEPVQSAKKTDQKVAETTDTPKKNK
ncbi:putative CtpA-like serine protease [Ephemeroptericola cinctiostellae]|uniref:Putative CtpA-like serine protease n=1 Tax=Ephemeroptericola cinctiostellae TaxID=2268024 RepID=A0A345D9Z8_9BURK|nr:S41 family peptidase [Ephemeroptericola cinctiostellae]AXF85186.1 putative CtpA-like serine protease [Ephemeroptericola cinctiostellae]